MIVQFRIFVVTPRFRRHPRPGDTAVCACSAAVTFTRPDRVWRLVRSDHRMPEPANVVARAQAFAASARDLRPLVLLTVGDFDGVSGHLLTAADRRADKVVLNLAQAVAARAEPVTGIPDRSRTRVVGMLRVNRRAAPGRDTQKGADPAETARRVETALRTFGATPDDPPTWTRWWSRCWPAAAPAARCGSG